MSAWDYIKPALGGPAYVAYNEYSQRNDQQLSGDAKKRKIFGVSDDPNSPNYVPPMSSQPQSGFTLDGSPATSNGGDYASNSHSTGNPVEDLSIAISGQGNAADLKSAGDRARNDLIALSNMAWARQMQGLQRALGSMNSYNGVLSNLYGVPTNYYDPNLSGGIEGQGPPPPRPIPPRDPSLPAANPKVAPTTRGYPPVTVAPASGPSYETRNGRGAF